MEFSFTLVLFWQALFTTCIVGSTSSSPVYSIDDVDTPPKLIYETTDFSDIENEISPRYKIQGEVTIELEVSAKGEAREIRVLDSKVITKNSTTKDIEEAVVDAIKKWTFEPAVKDGAPVACKVEIVIPFRD